MSETVMTGTTIKIQGTFTHFAPVGSTGSTENPDDTGAVEVNIYNSDEVIIDTGTATYSGTVGVFTYDWTVPDEEGGYYIEFKGDFGGKPELNRKKYKAKFEPVETS